MSASLAWETHGCYRLGSAQYYEFPVESALNGCHDEWNSLDHRDPSHPVRNILKSMFQMRVHFPVLNDGYFLQQLSNQTRYIQYPGSKVLTETGLWSTVRGRFSGVQDFTGLRQGNQNVWLVYQNDNDTIKYLFDCSKNETALISPYESGTTVKNLFYPFDEYTLKASSKYLGIDGSEQPNGCLDELEMPAWGFKAFVPKAKFVAPGPMVTKFLPGHDARVRSKVAPGQKETVQIELHFSAEMDCDYLTKTLQINSTTEDKRIALLDMDSVKCQAVAPTDQTPFVGGIPTLWTFVASLTDVSNGVHSITDHNVTAKDGSFTDVSTKIPPGHALQGTYGSLTSPSSLSLLTISTSVSDSSITLWCSLDKPTTPVRSCTG